MKKILGSIFAISTLISSCNLPIGNNAPDSAVATAAAMTVQAALDAGAASPSLTNTPASAEATPTFSDPFITVEDVTNCRTGPGVNFERVTQLLPNEQVKVIGVYPPGYWIVSSQAGTCWVSAEFATPIGSVNVVPTLTAPPTPTGNAPERVRMQKWDIFCNWQTGLADVTIKWSDVDGETGYRIVRNDVVIAELPANTTQYSESINLLSGQSVGYSVIAFNAIGTTSSSTIPLSC
jgi:hypothetical protein